MSDRQPIDLPEHRLCIVRHVSAPPQLVFDAWTKPAMVRQWLFTSPDTNIVLDVDMRIGGRWTIGDRRDGVDYIATGEYLEIDPPRRLVFTFAMPQFSPNCDRITVRIEPHREGSIMTFTQEGIDIAAELRESEPNTTGGTEWGWNQMFALLERVVREVEDER